MEIYERIRQLRKEKLNLSQEAFAEKLGVSRSVIKNIELNTLARPEQKLPLIKLICKEFSVSEDWLLNGTGDMFDNEETEYAALIDQIMNGENEFAKNIFKTFAKFDESEWEALHNMMETYFSVTSGSSTEHKTKTLKEPTLEELEYEYKKKNYSSALTTISSASSSTEDTEFGKTGND